MASKRAPIAMGPTPESEKHAKQARTSSRQRKAPRHHSPPLSTAEEVEQQKDAKVADMNREIAHLRQLLKEKIHENKELAAANKELVAANKELANKDPVAQQKPEDPIAKVIKVELGEKPAAFTKEPWTDAYKTLRQQVDECIADTESRPKHLKAYKEYSPVVAHGPRSEWPPNPYYPRNKLAPMPPPEVLAGMTTMLRSHWLNYSPAAYVLNDNENAYRLQCQTGARVKKEAPSKKAKKEPESEASHESEASGESEEEEEEED